MIEDFLPFSRPSIGPAEIAAVTRVMASGWLTTGSQAAAFEEAFAQSCQAQAAVALASATAGMHLALTALGIGPGDEVITPSMTWVSTVNLIRLCGATPVFCDIDRHTLMSSAAHIAPCITPRTKLIVPVHFAGASLDLAPIRALATQHNIPLVEDAAHALGTSYQGQPIGATGTAIFSFHPIKNITCGEGGMVVSADSAFLDHIRCLKFHGLGVDAYDRATQSRAPQAEVLEPGYKYNLTDMAAALGLVQLDRLTEFNERRHHLAQLYLQELRAIDEIIPLAQPDYDQHHAWHLFIIRVDEKQAGLSRDAFMTAMQEKNIGTGLHFRAVHEQKFYRQTMPEVIDTLANTQWNSKRICSLPLFPAMTDQDVHRVIKAIKEVLQ